MIAREMTPRHAIAAPASQLAYEQAAAALAQQQQILDSLRSRAGTLLSGAAISTSFLGDHALSAGSLRLTSWIAIGCFVMVGGTSAAILWPRLALELPPALPATRRGRNALSERSIAALLLALTDHLGVAYERNEVYIARIASYLRMGAVFLMLEVLWWVADLAVRV